MNEYVTFHRVLDIIQDFQEQSPILNTFAYGNLVDFGQLHVSGGTVEYPFLFVVPQSITYDENTTTYQLSLIFADLLNYDLSNERDCVSDMSLQAKRFLSYMKRGIRTFPEIYDNLDINFPVSAIPFFERFGDHVAGVAMDCNLIIFEDLNACDFYPTPTASPVPQPTPSITPTNTETPTPTPTPTPPPVFCVGAGFNPSVGGVKIENDGLYVFGSAEFYDLQDVSKVAKLNSTTAQLQAFQPYFPADTTNTITDVIKRSDGSFYFAGTFIEYSGQSRTRLVKVNPDLSIDTTFQQRSINAEPLQLYLNESTEELIVAGAFTNYTGNTNLRNLIKVNALTNDILPTFPTNIVNNNVNGLQPDGNGNLFIFGAFTTFTGTTNNRIAKISESDGTLVSGFNIGTGFNGIPTDMVVDSVNNRIYVVGGFTQYSGVSQNRLACINATTGFIDTSFTNEGFNSGTASIVQNKFGDLFVLGGFTAYGGSPTRQLAKITSVGTSDNTFSTNTGPTSFPFFNNFFGQGNAHSMLAVDDNYLYVAAPFTGYKGQPLSAFIRLDFDGNLDTIYNC